MARFASVLYGGVAYGAFLVSVLYAIGFVGNVVVPKGIDSGGGVSLAEALIVDTLLLGLFAVQHSVMARPAFKRVWTKIVPEAVERSTFVLFASLALMLLFWQWRPITAPVWSVENEIAAGALHGISFAGWALVFLSTFMISHFELFGLKQVALHWLGRATEAPEFRTPSLYRHVRHPIYLGFLMAFWATPTMSAGRLLFAAVTTAYILIGIRLEERDLVAMFGGRYEAYRRRVAMLIPGFGSLPSRSVERADDIEPPALAKG
jgi:protein-S-isoprenylcysteine O-methyltransferase Ste14